MANDEKGSPGRYEDEHHIKHHIDDDMPLNPCCQTSRVVYYWATYELPCSESPCLFLLRKANNKKKYNNKRYLSLDWEKLSEVLSKIHPGFCFLLHRPLLSVETPVQNNNKKRPSSFPPLPSCSRDTI